jgi:hypothetical protein
VKTEKINCSTKGSLDGTRVTALRGLLEDYREDSSARKGSTTGDQYITILERCSVEIESEISVVFLRRMT